MTENDRTDRKYRVIGLFNDGLSLKQISLSEDLEYQMVNSTIKRARDKGLITRVRRPSPTPFWVLAKIPIGSVSSILLEHITDEVRDHIEKLVLKNQYETVAECIADIITDDYFKTQEEEKSLENTT